MAPTSPSPSAAPDHPGPTLTKGYRPRDCHPGRAGPAAAPRRPPPPAPSAHGPARRGNPRADHPRRRLGHAGGRRSRQRDVCGRLLQRRHGHGRGDGRRRLPGRRRRLPPGDHRRRTRHRPVALRRRAPGRGRAVAPRRRAHLPRDDPGLGRDPADLGRARPRRRWRGLRPRPHRRGHPGSRGTHLRHRARRRPLGDRRGRRHAEARWSRTARAPLRRRPHPHRVRARGPRPGPHRCLADRRPGQPGRRRGGGPRPRRPAAGVEEACLRRAPARRRPARQGHHAGAPRALGPQHRDGPGPLRRPHRGRGGQQPAAPRRLPGLAVGREGLPLRADVRRVRRPSRGARGRPGLPPRRRPGVGRSRTPRRQAAPRLQ